MLIKICGLTNPADALAAAEAGADALGFVFAPSLRSITPDRAREIGDKLPFGILRVGVFVSPSLEQVKQVIDEAGLDLAQIHGDFPGEGWTALGTRAIRAARVGRDKPGMELVVGGPRYLLLDAYQPGMNGGTGMVFSWPEAAAYGVLGVPLIAAGGLKPSNVQAALDVIRPAGVDVSSGVEAEPGRKDPALITAFVTAVREWEAREGRNKDGS